MSSSDEDSDCNESQDDTLLSRAFHIRYSEDVGKPNFPPTSGNEYLRRVQEEYRLCPKVVVADIDTSKFLANRTVKIDQTGSCLPAPEGFAPTNQWQKSQVSLFSDLRRKILIFKSNTKSCGAKIKSPVPLPKLDDDVGWCKLCFGTNSVKKELKGELDEGAGTLPYASLVCSISQPLLEQVLNYHVSWMEVTGFSSQQGRWFYALLACLEKPLTPEACSSLRSLARSCATLRATLPSKEDSSLVPLNLLITLVSRYFDQKDLAD